MHHSIFKEACHNYDGLDCRVSPRWSNCFTDAANVTWIHNKLLSERWEKEQNQIPKESCWGCFGLRKPKMLGTSQKASIFNWDKGASLMCTSNTEQEGWHLEVLLKVLSLYLSIFLFLSLIAYKKLSWSSSWNHEVAITYSCTFLLSGCNLTFRFPKNRLCL